MCGFTPRIHASGAELVILGNGTPEQAAWFVKDFHIETPVLTDPDLASHAIAGARRARLMDPRVFLRAAAAMAQGFRQTRTMGSAGQLGGVFVITPAGKMPYRYISAFAGDHPNPEDVLHALESPSPRPPATEPHQ